MTCVTGVDDCWCWLCCAAVDGACDTPDPLLPPPVVTDIEWTSVWQHSELRAAPLLLLPSQLLPPITPPPPPQALPRDRIELPEIPNEFDVIWNKKFNINYTLFIFNIKFYKLNIYVNVVSNYFIKYFIWNNKNMFKAIKII